MMTYYLIFINIVAFFLYGVDKYSAIKKKNRISEFQLLVCSLLGGGIGSIIGMFIFRHKTSKWYFWVINFLFLIFWIYCIVIR